MQTTIKANSQGILLEQKKAEKEIENQPQAVVLRERKVEEAVRSLNKISNQFEASAKDQDVSEYKTSATPVQMETAAVPVSRACQLEDQRREGRECF